MRRMAGHPRRTMNGELVFMSPEGLFHPDGGAITKVPGVLEASTPGYILSLIYSNASFSWFISVYPELHALTSHIHCLHRR